jgi:hypothetical protein
MERVRHHTDPRGLRAIRQNMAIRRNINGGVDVERQPFGPLYRWEGFRVWSASDELSAHGQGAYVEFNLLPERAVAPIPGFWISGGRNAATIVLTELEEALELDNLEPVFVRWFRWYHWFLPWKRR